MFFWDSSSEDEDDKKDLRIRRRDLRDASDPLQLNEKEYYKICDSISIEIYKCKSSRFRKRFRLSRELFQYILLKINIPEGKRETAIPPVIKLATALKVLASYQSSVGDDYMLAMARNTVSVVFSEMLTALEKLCPEWINFDENNFNTTKEYFYAKYRIPGVIGCIDGTHVGLLKPNEDEHMFYNRKGFHSLNVMLICDHMSRIIAINPLHGGASHDSFVWGLSNEKKFLEQRYSRGDKNSWLLGDSGYPLEPWIMTPYRAVTESTAEAHFNYVHSCARSCVERCIGILKSRWRCLLLERKSRMSAQKVAAMTNVSAALHNMCIQYNIQWDEAMPSLDLEHAYASDGLMDTSREDNLRRTAKRIRDSIKCSLASNISI